MRRATLAKFCLMSGLMSGLMLGLMLLVPGCPPTGGRPPALVGTGMDMFGPRAMRLHGLTRLTADSAGKPVLEAHVEFTDQFGDVTKAVGAMRVALYESTTLAPHARELVAWDASIETPAANKEHWDPITRTYVFRHPIDEAVPAGRLLLAVRFTIPNGETLTAELPMAK